MNIMGVDVSTKAVTAVQMTHEKDLVGWWHIEFNGKIALPRAVDATHKLQAIPWSDNHLVCFERPAGKGINGLMDMMRIEGICIALIDIQTEAGFEPEVWEMVPGEWKRRAGMKGNASKETIKAFAFEHMNIRASVIPFAPQDFYDAYCITLAAINFNAEGVPAEPQHRSMA